MRPSSLLPREQTSQRRVVGNRNLRIEPLEDRRMLAVLTVNSLADNTAAGDSLVTLREAVIAANDDEATDLGQAGAGADTIQFAASLFTGGAASITLTAGDLAVTTELSIDGPGQSLLTISGDNAARIFHVDDGDGGEINLAVAIRDMTLADGFASGNTGTADAGRGGAIYSAEALNLERVTVRNNTAGNAGGGVYAKITNGGALSISDSTVSGNQAAVANGGGIAILASEYASATLTNLTLSDNTAAGAGGGLSLEAQYNGVVSLADSTVTGNDAQRGGGVHAYSYNNADLLIERSTISGNDANVNDDSDGGGIDLRVYAASAVIRETTIAGNLADGMGGGMFAEIYESNLTLVNSTISGNQTDSSGGGIYIYQDVSSSTSIAHSTLTGNTANGDGGGIYSYFGGLTLDHTIAAGNSAASGYGPDLFGYATVDYALVGNDSDAALTLVGSGNQIGTSAAPINPLLASLADNGGPTLTHQLQAGSPALNAGDPMAAGAPAYDQRGTPFVRVAGGQIDLGAVEKETLADFDADSDVDGSDFLAWQRGFGIVSGALKSDGDADNNGAVNAADFAVWEDMFGDGATTEAAAAAGDTLAAAVLADDSLAAAAAISISDNEDATEVSESQAQQWLAAISIPATRDRVFSQIGAASLDFGDIAASRRIRSSSHAPEATNVGRVFD